MYGYFVSSGYRGFVDGTWMLFPIESEYYEYMKECPAVSPIRCPLNQSCGKVTPQDWDKVLNEQ